MLSRSARVFRTFSKNLKPTQSIKLATPIRGFQIRPFSTNKETEGESVRNKEIEFYTNLNDWWGENCPQAQLHKYNKVRVNFIRRNLLAEHTGTESA